MSAANFCDISVVVNGHREGLVLLPSLRCAAESIALAEHWGVRCEMIVMLDRPDGLTSQVARSAGVLVPTATVIEVDHGDLGESRNAAVRKARGKYVAFLDGDDLWCTGWLKDAFTMASTDSRKLVLHPDFNVYFGHNPHIFTHVDMEDPAFHVSVLALFNVWTSLCFAPRDLLLSCPYPKTDLSNQIGYEDWGWNMRAITAGALHKVVPQTFHAIRNKSVSLVRQTASAGCFPAYPPMLFAQRSGEDTIVCPESNWRSHG
jgi:glycosyltransferase involved in cell wall biosynthesis